MPQQGDRTIKVTPRFVAGVDKSCNSNIGHFLMEGHEMGDPEVKADLSEPWRGKEGLQEWNHTNHAIFFILNDAPNSNILGFVVNQDHVLDTNDRWVSLEVVGRDQHNGSRGESFHIDSARHSQWKNAVDNMLGGQSVCGKPILQSFTWELGDCADRTGANAFDEFVEARFAAREIGPQCRRDTIRLLSALNMASIQQRQEFSEEMLRGIGEPEKSQGRTLE